MAGGPGTAELAGEVSRAGGLGVLPVTGRTTSDAVAATKAAIAAAGEAPVAVNAQLAPPTPATGDAGRISAVLAPFRAELGLPVAPPPSVPPDDPLALLEACVAAGASAITTFGDPAAAIPIARAAGIPLLAMVTTPAGALVAAAAGADGVIAQGAESGGHRSTLDPTVGPAERREIGTVVLVRQIVSVLGEETPVIASGGIMDGHGIAAVLALGAAGVSLGTRFLLAREADVAPCYREALRVCAANETIVTDAVTGRPARWIANRIVAALVEADVGTLGWGAQGRLIADVRRAAAAQGRADLLPMLTGQGAALAGPIQPASEIVAQLMGELDDALVASARRPPAILHAPH